MMMEKISKMDIVDLTLLKKYINIYIYESVLLLSGFTFQSGCIGCPITRIYDCHLHNIIKSNGQINTNKAIKILFVFNIN